MKQFASIVMSIMLILCVVALPNANTKRVFADGYNGSTYEGASAETIPYYTKADGCMAKIY